MNFKKWLNEQLAVYDPRKKVDWWGAPRSYIIKQLDPITKEKEKEKEKEMTSLFDQLHNPREHAVKKYFQEILKERCAGNKDIIEKISHYIITDRDLKELGSLVADLYESGYMKALDDYRGQLKELGLEVKIKAEENTSY